MTKITFELDETEMKSLRGTMRRVNRGLPDEKEVNENECAKMVLVEGLHIIEYTISKDPSCCVRKENLPLLLKFEGNKPIPSNMDEIIKILASQGR